MERRTRSVFRTAAFIAIFPLFSSWCASSRAAEAENQAAPADTLCGWGRLADGHGAFVRCLTREEAVRLRDAPPSPPAAPAQAKDVPFSVDLDKVVPDSGTLLDATKSFHKAKERLLACAKDGGVSSDGGEVELRFWVGGRGRAEGVSVQKRRGVSAAFAKCVADVVDRRYVGYPDGPEVGATLVVTMKKK